MSVFKIEKTRNYTVMSNYHLKDKNLSYKAKGLLSFMLSLPEDWDYSLSGLCAISKESRDGIRSILKELQKYHYVKIEKVRGKKGNFEYNYLIYEIPYFIEHKNEKNNPGMEKPHLDNPGVEEPTEINTNKLNIKKQIDKDDKTKASFFVPEEHNRLTLELIETNYIDEEDSQIFSYDDMFKKLLEDNSYRNLMIMIHYIVPRIISNNFKDEDGNDIKNKFGYFKNAIENSIYKFNLPEDIYDNCYDEFER